MTSRFLTRAGLLLVPLVCACPDRTETQNTGAPDASTVAARVRSSPEELQVILRYEASDGGMVAIPFVPGGRPLIERTQTLEVNTNLALVNSRIRVFDEADRAMVSDDEVLEPPPAPAGYRIRFPAPLKAGHRYTVVIDAQTGAIFSDSSGRPQVDQRLEVQIAGEKEKPEPPVKTPKRRRRR